MRGTDDKEGEEEAKYDKITTTTVRRCQESRHAQDKHDENINEAYEWRRPMKKMDEER